MPYKRKYKKKYYPKKSYNNTNYYPRATSAIGVASKALVLAYGIKRLMNVEFKFHDVQLNGTNVSTSPLRIELTNIPQGDTSTTRDGAQVKLTSINIKYFIQSYIDDVVTLVRVILVQDRQTNQALYNIADLLFNYQHI